MNEAQARWRREHPERMRAARKKYEDAHRGEPEKAKPRICKVCGGAYSHAWRKTCSDACESYIASVTMKRTNLKHASARMKTHNPMHRGDARERMTATLKRIGHKPPVHGGNGNTTPTPVATLHALLPGFTLECAIPTKKPSGSGYPPSYKVDLGNTAEKVAVEVDGKSHGLLSRREQDRKKDELLASLGWIVLRFTNAEALENSAACAALARDARK